MSVSVSVPKDGRIEVAVLNGSTATVIPSGSVVRLSTGSSPNQYKVTVVGATAGTCIRLFGVVEHRIATGGIGACVIHGPAVAMANGAITVKAAVGAQHGTAGVRGRVIAATAGTAGVSDDGTYLGWAMGVGSTGAFVPIFVNTAHVNVA